MEAVGHLRSTQRCFRQMLSASIDRLSAYQRAARSGGHGMHIVRVGIMKSAISAGSALEAMEVRVVDVNAAVVAPAAVIPRMKRLSPTEREPAKANS